MSVRTAVLAAFVGGALAVATPAAAQFGFYAGYDFESEEGLLGAHVHFPITVGDVAKTTITPQFEVLTTTDILVINTGASIRFHPWYRDDTQVSPYFGTGLLLGYNDFSEDVEVGIQALAGLDFTLNRLRPFTQIEVVFGGFDVTAIIVGLAFEF